MPKRLLLMRHPQSKWNVVKNRMARNGKQPIYYPGYSDTDLTALGKVEACLAGDYLYRRYGKIGRFVRSHTKRTDQAENIIVWKSKMASLKKMQGVVLEQMCEISTRKMTELFRDLIEAIEEDPKSSKTVKLIKKLYLEYLGFVFLLYPNDEEKRWRMLFNQNTAEAFLFFKIHLVDFVVESDDASEARKAYLAMTKYFDKWRRICEKSFVRGDRFDNKQFITFYVTDDMRISLFFGFEDGDVKVGIDVQSVSEFYSTAVEHLSKTLFEDTYYDYCGDTVLVIAHAKRIVHLRQALEGFGKDKLKFLLAAEGTEFPQNVSMVEYENCNNVWQRVGDPYFLPEGIVSLGGRDLGLNISHQRLSAICKKLDIAYKDVSPFLVK
jgi:hypothetical protein